MGLIIDGIAASEAIDSSGEILDIKGCDISDLDKTGVLNWEHRGEDANGASANDVIGRITYAKKIFNEKDCENDREKSYWGKVELPFIYIKVELFDDDGHPGAVAAAAIMRHYHRQGEPLLIRYSIEGSTLDKDGITIKRSIARRAAATLKPCNRSCFSGVLEDQLDTKPPKKKDLLAEISADAKKFEEPYYMKLGGDKDVECNPILKDETSNFADKIRSAITKLDKTISAGSYSGAPGSLTGGAALQREDLGKRISVTPAFKAAIRDWDGVQDLKRFLKFRLPEVSDKFIDRFADLTDDFRIRRKDFLVKKLAEKQTVFPGMGPAEAPADRPEFKIKPAVTFKKGGAWFDQDQGILHINKGSFKVYIPGGPKDYQQGEYSYQKALEDPQINEIHSKAMKQWVGLHRLARSGKLPDQVVAHAAMFSACSPNTAVPIQELAYGFMQDLKTKGLDFSKEHSNAEMQRWEKEWKKMSYGQFLPEYMRNHFASDESILLGGDQKPTKDRVIPPHWDGKKWVKDAPKKAGERADIGLSDQKFKAAMNYPEVHNAFAQTFANSRGDARATSGVVNAMKTQAINAGHRGEEAEQNVEGFAPKTIRYALGMAGGGNVLIPDTHLIRHLFGLPLKDKRNWDLKEFLWAARNEPILGQLDKYYYDHHPAVAHTRQSMKSQFGEDFGENAIFPSFWLHWLTIQKHDQMRNWNSLAHNEGTDHAVYFNSIRNILKKYGIPHDSGLAKFECHHDASLPARTAHAYKELEERYGHAGASLAYYAYMVPALTGANDIIQKMQHSINQFKKAEEKGQHVVFKGNHVEPGELEVLSGDRAGQKLPLLHVNKLWHYVQDESGGNSKISSKAVGRDFRVVKPPRIKSSVHVVSASRHGIPHLSESPEQQALLEGIDFKAPREEAPEDAYEGDHTGYAFTGWRKSAAGLVGYVKPSGVQSVDESSFTTAHREAAYHALARDFFELGEHVPVTAAFKHPVNNKFLSIQEIVQNGYHGGGGSSGEVASILHLGHMGQLDKMALMDMILHHTDRGHSNCLLSEEAPYLHLIDNGFTLTNRGTHGTSGIPYIPEYWRDYENWTKTDRDMNRQDSQPMHPEAVRWVRELDPQALKTHMDRMGIPDSLSNESVRRLMLLKKRVEIGPSLSFKEAFMSPWTKPEKVAY